MKELAPKKCVTVEDFKILNFDLDFVCTTKQQVLDNTLEMLDDDERRLAVVRSALDVGGSKPEVSLVELNRTLHSIMGNTIVSVLGSKPSKCKNSKSIRTVRYRRTPLKISLKKVKPKLAFMAASNLDQDPSFMTSTSMSTALEVEADPTTSYGCGTDGLLGMGKPSLKFSFSKKLKSKRGRKPGVKTKFAAKKVKKKTENLQN